MYYWFLASQIFIFLLRYRKIVIGIAGHKGRLSPAALHVFPLRRYAHLQEPELGQHYEQLQDDAQLQGSFAQLAAFEGQLAPAVPIWRQAQQLPHQAAKWVHLITLL